MATNPSIKKSSIPRASRDIDLTKSKFIRPKPPQQPNPNQSKVQPNDGLLKEDEDSVRRSLLELEADHARMKKTLEGAVQDAEERLEAMRKLMEERERLCSTNLAAAAERTGVLEEQVENYEKTLIENNIDPVTGEAFEQSAEQSEAVEKQKKITKGDVSKMREKLQKMNDSSDKCLVDVQNILQEIHELEATSQRAGGGKPPQEPLSGDEMMALIQEVEEAQKKEEQKKKKEKKDSSEDEDVEEDEEEEEEESEEAPSAKQDEKEKENARPPSKSDVFITQK